MNKQIPVTIIGGFLGAGKTTLLNRVLAESHGVRFAVIVNDFGSLSIDDKLVRSHDGETITFANGCICCSLGSSLVGTIDRVVTGSQQPDHFLVEASGVSDPRAIADVATLHPHLQRDLIVILVDAETFNARDNDVRLKDTVSTQLASADLIVLNKCDLTDDAKNLGEHLTASFGVTAIRAINASFPLDVLSVVSATRPKNPDLKAPAPKSGLTAIQESTLSPHRPEQIFNTITVRFSRPVTDTALRQALNDANILRAKGFLHVVEQPGLTHVQQVGSRISFTPWVASAQKPELVLIGIADVMDTVAIEDLATNSLPA